MKILVTGANGLLGQKLVRHIERKTSDTVIATARKPLNIALARGAFQILNITDPEEVKKVIRTTRPDVVVNAAAMTQVDQCETDREACVENNTTAVRHLVEACADAGCHLVQVSTDFIFDGSHGPLDETETPGPVNFYGQTKLAAEQIVTSSAVSWSIVRTVLVYGITEDMSRSNIVLWVKKNLEEGKTINVVQDQWRTPTLAEDLAKGCYLVASKKASGIFHVSGEEMMTPYDMAMATADFFSLDKGLIHPTDSTKFKQPAARPLKTGFIIDKARRELGYQPHSFREGLALLAQQMRG
jgi:dTDP-4-dehydrorhamnose reductase